MLGTSGLSAIVFRKHALRINGASLLRQLAYTGGKGRSLDRRDAEAIQFIAELGYPSAVEKALHPATDFTLVQGVQNLVRLQRRDPQFVVGWL